MTTDVAMSQSPRIDQHERSFGVRAAAIAALRWPLNLWLETALWLCLTTSLAVAYSVSYTSLAAVAGALGFGAWERWLVPLAIDVPLAASVLGQLLAARWRSPWWVKALLLLLSLATAPLTLAGNALNGAVRGDALDLSHVDTLHLVAFAIPGACVVMVAVITSTMLGQRATLTQQAAARARAVRSIPQGGTRSKRVKAARPASRSSGTRPAPGGDAARARLRELLQERPSITAAEAAPLIDRSQSYTRALLAEERKPLMLAGEVTAT